MKLRHILSPLLALTLAGCMSTQREIPEPDFPSVESTAGTSAEPAQPTGESPGTAESTPGAESGESDPTTESTPTTEPQDAAHRILAGMSPEEKAGQLVLARYPGASIAAEVLEEFHPGGFTLFASDFQDGTPEGIAAELAQLQQDSGIPLLFAVDEEGGTVVRVSKYSQYRAEKFPAQSEVLASGGTDGVYSDAAEKSALLKSLGLNMNLAPVCDLPRSAEDYIYDRAFGTDADSVSAAVASAVRSYADNGTICALKHFPGYGNNLDTHTGISIDSRPLTELESLDLLPFRAGIDAGAPVVMVSHNIVECVNAELPGSLSAAFAGIAGTLFAHNYASLSIGTDKFNYNASIMILVYVVLGGIGNIRGSIIATIILYVLPEELRFMRDYRMLMYAIVLIVVMLYNWSPKMQEYREVLRFRIRNKFAKKRSKEDIQV